MADNVRVLETKLGKVYLRIAETDKPAGNKRVAEGRDSEQATAHIEGRVQQIYDLVAMLLVEDRKEAEKRDDPF